MSIKTILIENKREDLEHLINELKEISYVDVVASFSDPVEAIKFVSQNETDLIISDIEMPGVNGIDAIKLLSQPPLVIFISSHSKYAIESFDVKPLHYLVKPFSKEGLLKATYRALETINTKSNYPDDFMFVYADKVYDKILYSDILYIQAEQNFVKIITQQKTYMVLASISKFIKQLPTGQFPRVHKSYAVNIKNVTSYTSQDIFIDKHPIPIGEAYKEPTSEFLTKFTISRSK
ncbi:MAG TPA: LytTR family DNA-binding domain-containing protein [Flavipsychrobacter sp.]|nr:LytTR family DNA-binding domain-containing protein [Flavipsychrobacter sp.]